MSALLERALAAAEARHDTRCIDGPKCPERHWHVENTFLKNDLKDVLASAEAEIAALKSQFGVSR